MPFRQVANIFYEGYTAVVEGVSYPIWLGMGYPILIGQPHVDGKKLNFCCRFHPVDSSTPVPLLEFYKPLANGVSCQLFTCRQAELVHH